MLLAAYNLVRFDHVSQQLNFRVLLQPSVVVVAEFNLLAVEWDETTVNDVIMRFVAVSFHKVIKIRKRLVEKGKIKLGSLSACFSALACHVVFGCKLVIPPSFDLVYIMFKVPLL